MWTTVVAMLRQGVRETGSSRSTGASTHSPEAGCAVAKRPTSTTAIAACVAALPSRPSSSPDGRATSAPCASPCDPFSNGGDAVCSALRAQRHQPSVLGYYRRRSVVDWGLVCPKVSVRGARFPRPRRHVSEPRRRRWCGRSVGSYPPRTWMRISMFRTRTTCAPQQMAGSLQCRMHCSWSDAHPQVERPRRAGGRCRRRSGRTRGGRRRRSSRGAAASSEP